MRFKNKQPLLLIFYILFIVLAAFSCKAPNTKPNIIILYADDLGYGDISCQNPDSKIKTPNIDKLAFEGMRFTDAHSSSGICSPSRFALLTGIYHWRRRHQIIGPMGSPDFFKPGDLTLPQMLKNSGYYTMAVGKWHLGWNFNFINKPSGEIQIRNKKIKFYCPDDVDWTKPISGGPIDRGFNYYFGDGTINFPPYCWFENDRVLKAPDDIMTDNPGLNTKEGNWEFRPGPKVKGWNPYEVLPTLGKKAVELIHQQKKNQPFFLYFAFPSPHAPIIPNDEFSGKSNAGAYGDYVVETDFYVGQILKALKEKDLEENTIVIFSSDNGPEKYAFDRIHNFNHKSMGKLRGLKRDLWEGGHRIPFIIKWPGKIKPGTISEEVINQVDLMRTIATIIGYELPDNAAVDSYNILPVLLGEKYSKPLREATVHNTFENRYALRKGNWLLIDSFTGEHSKAPDWYYTENGYIKYDKNTKTLLFNLKEDIEQRHNLSDQYPEKVNEMLTLLKKYRESGKSVPNQ